jgi:osmotically-inducible protein OsmY
MRLFELALLGGAFSCGCAHEQPVASTPSPASVAAYRQVRAGQQPIVRGDGVTFCAGNDGVKALSQGPATTGGYADKFRDHDVQSSVRDQIRRDPALAGQAIDVHVEGGQANISGNLASDADAVAATKDALGVPGVVSVKVQTTSPELPAPPHLAAVWCER